MNIQRIKEIQDATAYPDSVSVQQALLQVWNECKQEQVEQKEITDEMIEKSAKEWLSNNGIGIGTNITVNSCAWAMEEYHQERMREKLEMFAKEFDKNHWTSAVRYLKHLTHKPSEEGKGK
jgi:hypothetical protein